MENWFDAGKFVPEDGTLVLVCYEDHKIETGYYSETDQGGPCFITPYGFAGAEEGTYWAFIPDPPNSTTHQSRAVRSILLFDTIEDKKDTSERN